MRAELTQAWPKLSLYFGLHPWDVGRLSRAELFAYIDVVNKMGGD